MLTRRHFIAATGALLAVPAPGHSRPDDAQMIAWDAQVTPPNYDPATSNPWGLAPQFLPRRVAIAPGLEPGSIHVNASELFLYFIEEGGTAMRYGVAIGRGGLYQPGTYTIGRKEPWPSWTPTDAMIAREPAKYARYADGVPPGPDNPLGSRALYLYSGGRDTFLRIHGTPHPETIGTRASSGCVRMVMAHINGLYALAEVGAQVHLHPLEG